MVAKQDIWVFSESDDLLAELISGADGLAAQTGGRVVALAIGSRDRVPLAFAAGAHKVIWLGELGEQRLVEDYVPTIAELARQDKPLAVWIGATRRGRGMAGRLAARLDTVVVSDAREFFYHQGRLSATHLVYGGAALR
jgi:electron transfer flavoprotein alpha subunit